MAVAIGGVLTTLLLFWIFMQLKSVLIIQEVDEDFKFGPDFCWSVLTPKIMCFGKEILCRSFGNYTQNPRSTRNKGVVRTNQLFALLCLLLSNDVPLNPGPTGDYYQCIGCNKDQGLGTEYGSGKIDWICDTCIDTFCANSTTDHSVCEILTKLPKGIKFAHVNLCGILNKLDQVKILPKDCIFDVFAVTESKLDHHISDSEIQITGYTVIRRDRNRHGGGLLLFIKDKWSVLNVHKDETLEFMTVDIKYLNSPRINIGVVYRPPDSNAQWLVDFEERIEDLSVTGSEQVVLGDFTIDQLKSSNLKSMMEIFNLTQIITDPTRETRGSSTLIDHIYVNHPRLYSSRGVLPIGLSDHHLVYSVRKKFKNVQKLDHVYAKYRDQKKRSVNDFINDLNRSRQPPFLEDSSSSRWLLIFTIYGKSLCIVGEIILHFWRIAWVYFKGFVHIFNEKMQAPDHMGIKVKEIN